MSSFSNAAFDTTSALNEDDLKGLNARLKSQFASDFIQMMTEAQESECFTRCFRKPGTAMDKAEEGCLVRCMDRFMESWGVVAETVARVQQRINSQSQ